MNQTILKIALLFVGSLFSLTAQSVAVRQGLASRLEGYGVYLRPASADCDRLDPELPALEGESSGQGPAFHAWDGRFLYRLRFEGSREAWVQYGFSLGPTPERPAPVWFWRAPVRGPVQAKLLGGWEGTALLAAPLWEGPRDPQGNARPTGWFLGLLDLGDGELREVFRQVTPELPRLQAVTLEGETLVFTSRGTALRVDLLTRQAQVISEDFWKEAGRPLCPDPGSAPNPRVFGRPFLDGEGAILLPVEPKVEIGEADVQRAWGKLDEARRKELIDQGHWPLPKGRVAGWKGQASFLRFDPTARRWGWVAEALSAPWTHPVDRNFICTEFLPEVDEETPFQVQEGRILRFEPRPQDRPGATGPEAQGKRPRKGTGLVSSH